MNKHTNRLFVTTLAFVGATLIGLLLSLDMVLTLSHRLSDSVYQKHSSPNPEIVIIGMDERAIEAYGNMPWPRDIMAEAIEYLNKDSEKKPAVIGIDTLYTVEGDPVADSKLVEAVGNADNVVTAAYVKFGSEIVTLSDSSFYMDNQSVLLVEMPFDALADVSAVGHINAIPDTDSLLRHVLTDIEITDENYLPSFSQAIYAQYLKSMGEEVPESLLNSEELVHYLPFTSRPGSYSDGFSVVDLVDGTLDPDIFAGKIVLIGPYAPGMNDEHLTAIDHTEAMFGVEYQGNAVAAHMTDSFKSDVAMFPQQLILFVLSFALLLYFRGKKVLHSTVVWVSISLLWWLLCLAVWQMGYVLHVLYVPTAVTICYIVSIALNYIKALVEKRRIVKNFSRYLSPSVVSELTDADDDSIQLGGKPADIAVMFVDIRGFTAFSEALPATEVADILNRYLTLMSECIFKYGGTLDKFIGDGAMAFWGAPFPQEDVALRAVQAALDLIEMTNDLNTEIKSTYSHAIGIGVGINYGTAVIGNFGSPTRMDYTAIGDTVNVAARLESIATHSCILVSETVKDLLEGRVTFSSIGTEVKLKGKSKPMEVFKVEEIIRRY